MGIKGNEASKYKSLHEEDQDSYAKLYKLYEKSEAENKRLRILLEMSLVCMKRDKPEQCEECLFYKESFDIINACDSLSVIRKG